MKTQLTLLFILMTSLISYSSPDISNHSGDIRNDRDSIQEKSLIMLPDSAFALSKMLASRMNPVEFNPQRPFYNHSFRIGTGYSLNTLRLDNSMRSYSDTSEHQFVINQHSPIFSFSHTLAIDSSFSLGYAFGYSFSDILFDNTYYGSQRFFLSINPQLHLFRKYNFEYYIRLRIGVSYEGNELSKVPSERIQNLFPTGFRMFTGCTIAGINYLINDHLALSTELSIWCPETISFGLSYRFFHDRNKDEAVVFRMDY
ncbi:MAG: hypothetical protein IPM74_12230 [Crocinitomicaceae bacterium]|nr:hypothetical protein [Crocinitomicaceae bacterium]